MQKRLQQCRRVGCGIFAFATTSRVVVHDQLIGTESLFIEEDFRAQSAGAIHAVVDEFWIRWNINAQLLDQCFRYATIRSRALYGKRSSKAVTERATNAELVALGMPAEIVVIVEDQNASLGAHCLAVVMCGSQAADTASNDDQIVSLACAFRFPRCIPEGSIAQAVRSFK